MDALKNCIEEAKAKKKRLLNSLREEHSVEREKVLDAVIVDVKKQLVDQEERLARETQRSRQKLRKEIMQEYLWSTVGWGRDITEHTDEDTWSVDANIETDDEEEEDKIPKAPEDLDTMLNTLFGHTVTWNMEKDPYFGYSLVFYNVANKKVKKRKIADES